MLDADTILNKLPFSTLADELHAMHQQPIGMVDELRMESPAANADPNHFFIRTGWQPGEALGAKVISVFPGNNQDQAWPAVQAVYLLFEGIHGTPIACIDGTALTWLKTATDSALGARLLARPGLTTMLMIGAGEMSKHLIRAHCELQPTIRRVMVWNRTPQNAQRLCESDWARQLDRVSFEAIEDLGAAAAQAELICSATATPTPLLQGEWLQPGTHVDLVGAFTPQMREADDACLQRSSLFVDARETTLNHIGELMIPLASGAIKLDSIRADLSDLCQQRHAGRLSDAEITLFKNGGGGHLDLMIARILYHHCAPK